MLPKILKMLPKFIQKVKVILKCYPNFQTDALVSKCYADFQNVAIILECCAIF